MDWVKDVILTIDSCSTDTKVILLLILIALLIGLIFVLKGIVAFVKAGINVSAIMKSLKKFAEIIKNYELKTLAGFINMAMSLVLLVITVGVFLSVSFASLLGFNDSIGATRIIFVILTIVATLSSLWVLFCFEKQTELIKQEH